MESWRWVFRQGFAPLLSTSGLLAMRQKLKTDDPRLLQRATTVPVAASHRRGERLHAACALGWAGIVGDDLRTVGEVDRFFEELCAEADERLGEPGACRWFLAWYDDVPRDVLRVELLAEVALVLRQRFLPRQSDVPLAA
jgi:hypothetical protein